jgi:hypothetical protein
MSFFFWFVVVGIIFKILPQGFADVTLKERMPPARANECQNCHRAKNYEYIPKRKDLNLEHKDIKMKHGQKELACNFCHNKNNHNFLFSARKANDFSNSALVCQKCHSDVYEKWVAGTHGKRIGGWKKQTQLECIECHDPHNVSFPKWKG